VSLQWQYKNALQATGRNYELYRMHNLWLYAQARRVVGTGARSLLWLWIVFGSTQ